MSELTKVLDQLLIQFPVAGILGFCVWFFVRVLERQREDTMKKFEEYILKPHRDNLLKVAETMQVLLNCASEAKSLNTETRGIMDLIKSNDLPLLHADHVWKKEKLNEIKKNTDKILETILYQQNK